MEEEEEGGRGGDAGRLCLPAAPAAPAERTEGPARTPRVGDRDGDRVTPRGVAGPPPGRRPPLPPRAGNIARKVRLPQVGDGGHPQVGTTPGVELGPLPRKGTGDTPMWDTGPPAGWDKDRRVTLE